MAITDKLNKKVRDERVEISKDGGEPLTVSSKAFETVYSGEGYTKVSRPAEKLSAAPKGIQGGKAAGKGAEPKGAAAKAAEQDPAGTGA